MADASTAQLVTVAFAGGIASTVLSTLVRRTEFRREDHSRWLTLRREAYIGLLSAARKVRTDGFILGNPLGVAEGDVKTANAEHLSATMHTALFEAVSHIEQIRLLAPGYVVTAADDVMAHLYAVLTWASDPSRVRDMHPVVDFTAAIDRLSAATRRDLRVDSGPLLRRRLRARS